MITKNIRDLLEQGVVNNIPKGLLTRQSLREQVREGEYLIHTLSKLDMFEAIPHKELDTETLCLKDKDGNTCYHLLSDICRVFLLSKDLLSKEGLCLKNKNGRMPLHGMAEYEPHLIPNECRTRDLFHDMESGESPLHCWCKGVEWMFVPPHLFSESSLLQGDKRGSTPLSHFIKLMKADLYKPLEKEDKTVRGTLKAMLRVMSEKTLEGLKHEERELLGSEIDKELLRRFVKQKCKEEIELL